MGRELQKKKKRSSTNKVRMKPKSKKINPLGNAIIAANWYASFILHLGKYKIAKTVQESERDTLPELCSFGPHFTSQ